MPGHRHDPRHRVAALGNEHFLTFAYASEPAAQIRAQLTDSHFNRHCRYIRQHECSDIAPRRPQALLRLLEIREAGAQGRPSPAVAQRGARSTSRKAACRSPSVGAGSDGSLFADRNVLARKPENVAKSATPTVSMKTPTIRPPLVSG